MRFQWLTLTLALLLSACTHVHQTSGKATTEEIRDHLIKQLKCSELELVETGKDSFSGAGKSEQGDFTIMVTRKAEKISFQGTFAPPVGGGFSGFSEWRRKSFSGLGLKKSTYRTAESLTFQKAQ